MCQKEDKMTDFTQLRRKLADKLPPSRYTHTIGVAYTAACLAMRYGSDLKQAELAGLLHDSARQYDNEKIMEKCIRHGLEITEYERRNPILLHAKLGAWMASHKYQVDDPVIADAIRYHTTGREKMGLLEKIIYIADYIEPGRKQIPGLDMIRHLAFQDLDECIFQIMEHTLSYLKNSNSVIDTETEKAYFYYKEIHESKGE